MPVVASMTADPDRSALLATKLRLLVKQQWPGARLDTEGRFPGGATTVDVSAETCWVLTEGPASGRLGAALAVALRNHCRQLHVLVDHDATASVLARRLALFAIDGAVWLHAGSELRQVDAGEPAVELAPAPEAELYRPVLEAVGLEPVVEGGHLVGEWLGLEVGRVVVDDERGARVEAGVGRFDREVAAMMFADLGEADSLARAVDLVARFRVRGAEPHPINQLVAERWLRTVVQGEPSLVGAAALRPVGSAVPRQDLKSDGIATSVGVGLDGQDVVVACSTGVHLDLVPSAADDRLTHARSARLILVVPERDAVPITADLAALLREPAEVVTVPDDWRNLDGPVR